MQRNGDEDAVPSDPPRQPDLSRLCGGDARSKKGLGSLKDLKLDCAWRHTSAALLHDHLHSLYVSWGQGGTHGTPQKLILS